MSDQYLLILCGDPNKERYKNIEITGPLKIYIFGTHANDIYKKVTHPNKILLHNKSLETVIKLVAEDIYQNPTTILFSPGHPSGKDFKNFEDRGKRFSNLAMNLDG
jgi:UDP-N-acetylmuramoylalanine-D-glutamate ligase